MKTKFEMPRRSYEAPVCSVFQFELESVLMDSGMNGGGATAGGATGAGTMPSEPNSLAANTTENWES